MRRSTGVIGVFACVAAAAYAGPGNAQDLYGPPPFASLVWQQSGFYGTIGGRFENRGIGPVNSARFHGGSTSPGLSIEPNPNLGGPAAAIGYAFRDGTVPAWLGANFRVELSGWWLTGSDTATRSTFTPVGTPTAVATLNGFTPVVGLLGANLTEDGSATATMHLFRARVRIASDMPLAPSFVLSPFVGPAGGETQLKYSLRVNDLANGVPALIYAQNVKIRWSDIGGTAGARLTYSALPWLQLHVSGHADLVYRRARLDADDCFGVFVAFGGVCAANAGVPSSAISARANRFAVIAGGEAGVTFVGSFYLITIAGGAEHDTRVPALRVQQPGPATGTTGTSATLRFLGQTSYNASARLTLRF